MEQHPIPRQITTFEFKLVGFMTLKQFIYLVVFFPLAYIAISIFPIPILNFLLGAVIAGFGGALAFVPVNDRPLDVFIKNLFKRLISPTQYFYKKEAQSISFLDGQARIRDAQQVSNYFDSQQKLSKYLQSIKQSTVEKEQQQDQRKQSITQILHQREDATPKLNPTAQAKPSVEEQAHAPFIVGMVKNNKQMPLPGVLLYIKDQTNSPIRLLKTNPHGIFATYSELPPGDYTVEIKDPKDMFFFDTMKVHFDKNNSRPLEFYSRELL